MKESVVRNKSYAFALRIIKVYKYLSEEQRDFCRNVRFTPPPIYIAVNQVFA
jgi:hypothetical protein